MDLQEVPFIVTDTETTGTNADQHRIIEIGAVKVQGGRIVDRYQQLVNPGTAIPYQISRLTGITNSMVYGKPAIEEILDDYLSFLGDGVFVAHNARFDRRFINAELRRSGRSAMSNKSLCTARLARRLLSGLKSKGLSSLADFYNIRIVNRHRAYDDAAATAIILIRLLDKFRIQVEDPSLSDVLLLQMRPYRTARKPMPNVVRIREEILADLPARAGVYFMYDGSGQVIYIGKAKNLRSRVRSYFTGVEGHPPRTRELVRSIRDVSWEETGNELAALLKESKLIKEQQPRFNRALKKFGRKPFIKLDTTGPYPAVSSTTQLIDDGAEYYGPVRGNRHARFLVDLINRVYKLRECDPVTLAQGKPCMYHDIGRCLAPCMGDNDLRYQDEVERVRAFLRGDEHSAIARLEARMDEAAGRLLFEEARLYRDWIARLKSMQARQRIIAADVMDHNSVVVLGDDTPGEYSLYFIRFGRLADTLTVGSGRIDAELGRIRARLSVVFDEKQMRPDRYRKEEVEEVRILTSWLFANRDEIKCVHWSPGIDTGLMQNQIARLIGAAEFQHGPGKPTINA